MKNKENAPGSMRDIVEALENKSPKELLSYAIFNELEEAEYYSKLAAKAGRASVKALFLKMSEDSKNHHDWLYRLFKKMYPGEEPVKVDAPPVEVAPFYSEFQSVEDYISALKYCMESELFAKKTYELLAKVASDEDSRDLALNLAAMEEDHYQSLRKMYELMLSLEEEEILPEKLEPGGYLFTDELKAKYFLIDLINGGVRLSVAVRENPKKFLEMFGGADIEVVWITKTEVENSIRPEEIPILKKRFCRFLKEASERDETGAVFLQNLGYLALELGFKNMMDVVLYLKDCALLHDGYVLATAIKDAFSPREWALLTSELRRIS